MGFCGGQGFLNYNRIFRVVEDVLSDHEMLGGYRIDTYMHGMLGGYRIVTVSMRCWG